RVVHRRSRDAPPGGRGAARGDLVHNPLQQERPVVHRRRLHADAPRAPPGLVPGVRPGPGGRPSRRQGPGGTDRDGGGPMSIARFSVVALDTPDPVGLAEFYSAITGWEIEPYDDIHWIQLRSDTGATIACQLAPDHIPPRWPDPAHPQQAHLDFVVDDIEAAERRVLRSEEHTSEVQSREIVVRRH